MEMRGGGEKLGLGFESKTKVSGVEMNMNAWDHIAKIGD